MRWRQAKKLLTQPEPTSRGRSSTARVCCRQRRKYWRESCDLARKVALLRAQVAGGLAEVRFRVGEFLLDGPKKPC